MEQINKCANELGGIVFKVDERDHGYMVTFTNTRALSYGAMESIMEDFGGRPQICWRTSCSGFFPK